VKITVYIFITGCSILLGWLARTLGQPVQQQIITPTGHTTSLNLPKTEDRTKFCQALADGLVDPNKADFREYALQIVALRPDDQKIWKVLFEIWFVRDPSGAWNFANHHIDREAYSTIYHLAIRTWASIDPQAASLALSDSTTDHRVALLESALSADPAFALSLVQNWDLSTLREHSKFNELPWEDWIYELAKNNQGDLTQIIEDLENPDLLGAYFAGQAIANPTNALCWFSKQEDRERLLTHLGNYVGFANFYEPALMDFVSLHLPRGDRRLEIMRYALDRLAEREPMRAADETQRLFSDPHQQAEILAIIAEGLLRTDFEAAWELASRIDSSIHFLRRVDIPNAELSSDGTFQSHFGPMGYRGDLTNMRGLVNPSKLKAQLLTELLMVDRNSAIQHLSNLPPKDLAVIGPFVLDRWIWYSPKEAFTFFANSFPSDIDSKNLWRFTNYGYPKELLQEAFLSYPPGPFAPSLPGNYLGTSPIVIRLKPLLF